MRCLALVVGISEYLVSSYRLHNPGNDAVSVSNKLKELGFVVVVGKDLTMEEFDRVMKEFGESLKEYDAGLFFYAGHGFQIDGLNYLSAIDSDFDEYRAPLKTRTAFLHKEKLNLRNEK